MAVKTINIKLDDNLWKQAKAKAALTGKTLREYLNDLLKRDLMDKP